MSKRRKKPSGSDKKGSEANKRAPLSKRRKALRTAAIVLVVAAMAFSITANILVVSYSSSRRYTDVDEIPYNRVGLVLGTTDSLKDGRANLYFRFRMESAAELYHSGKINRILVSGDNHKKSYDEATAMLNALVALGVPDTAIKCDYAGFSTYDSMIRAKKVFGQNRLTVISQSWHNQRALYIAHRVGIDAVDYNAKDVVFRKTAMKNHIREWFARAKMVFDLVFQHDPHFLGDPIEI